MFSQFKNEPTKPSWSAFSQSISERDFDVANSGFMAMIVAPAHEINTLSTFVEKCVHISTKVNHRYTVIIVDQALYLKLMNLKSTYHVQFYLMLNSLFGNYKNMT